MGLAGAGGGFARPTLDFETGVWLLFPSNIGLVPQQYWRCFLGWGRVKETSKFKQSEERIISLNVAHIYGYDSKESGLVGPR